MRSYKLFIQFQIGQKALTHLNVWNLTSQENLRKEFSNSFELLDLLCMEAQRGHAFLKKKCIQFEVWTEALSSLNFCYLSRKHKKRVFEFFDLLYMEAQSSHAFQQTVFKGPDTSEFVIFEKQK